MATHGLQAFLSYRRAIHAGRLQMDIKQPDDLLPHPEIHLQYLVKTIREVGFLHLLDRPTTEKSQVEHLIFTGVGDPVGISGKGCLKGVLRQQIGMRTLLQTDEIRLMGLYGLSGFR